MADNHSIEKTYTSAVQAIKTAILQGQYEAAKETNRIQLALYYGIGRYLSLHTRKGVWGQGALKSISEQLQKELPGLRGFSETQMKKMRTFYEQWSALDTNSSVVTDELQGVECKYCINSPLTSDELKDVNSSVMTDELQEIEEHININSAIVVSNLREFPIEEFFNISFSHHVEIFSSIKDILERYYYIRRTAEEHLSVLSLRKLMREDAYHHQSLLPNNFTSTLGDAALARKAVMMFKDEYLLNFINVEQIGERDAEDVDERVVEQQIVQNIKNFIMTFGRDFAFIGNQYHLEVYGVEHFPDLLFFNRELNAMVCIELKTGAFKPSYLGQLTTYLRILDDKVKKAHENPSIGVVLCKEANKEYVEYVIQDYHKPMGVATYTSSSDMPEHLRKALPDVEELKKLL